jgi:hypothetical protein
VNLRSNRPNTLVAAALSASAMVGVAVATAGPEPAGIVAGAAAMPLGPLSQPGFRTEPSHVLGWNALG